MVPVSFRQYSNPLKNSHSCFTVDTVIAAQWLQDTYLPRSISTQPDGSAEWYEYARSDIQLTYGIINIIEGNYDAAVNYFGSKPSYNAALAKYLAGDANGAWRILGDIEMVGGMGYYMKAVVAASQDKSDVALENLKLAVENCKSPEWIKGNAKKDLEFAKLFETAEFIWSSDIVNDKSF